MIDERNHMRIWLAPFTLHGAPVWIGQVSRDIGVKPSHRFWLPTNHVIDPGVGDPRFCILQDMLAGETVDKLAFVEGHRPATYPAPHRKAEGDPCFDDGLRAVFVLAEEPMELSDAVLLDWALPPALEPYRASYVNDRSVSADGID